MTRVIHSIWVKVIHKDRKVSVVLGMETVLPSSGSEFENLLVPPPPCGIGRGPPCCIGRSGGTGCRVALTDKLINYWIGYWNW